MPMLADRRRKEKWTLNPGRQALWNKADSHGIKFGQGLMEKMGWKVGQGLGVNEQGIKEPLKVDIKNDSKGMGFKDNDNEWIQQQHEFNELLSKLSSSNNIFEKNAYNNHETTQIRTSLEEKSRHSKTRVHYQKFTRGKDLTKYSEKDLECILGSKKESSHDYTDSQDNGDACSTLHENTSTIISGGSMVDYFKEKMQKKATSKGINSLKFNKKEDAVVVHGNCLEALEQTVALKNMKKMRGNENSIKSYEILKFKKSDSSTYDNLLDVEKTNDFEGSLDDKRQKRDNQNINLNRGKMTDCLHFLCDRKNTEESDDRTEHIGSAYFSSNNTQILQKGQKERTEEDGSCEIGWANHLKEKEIISRKKKKLNDGNINCSEDTIRPKKKIKAKGDEKAITDVYVDIEKNKINSKKKKISKREIVKVDDEGKCKILHDDEINLVYCTERKSESRQSEKVKKDYEIVQNCEENYGEQECKNENERKETSKKENSKFSDFAPYKLVVLEKGSVFSDNSQEKMLTSIRCACIDKFQGSNLGQVKGYGILNGMKNKGFLTL